MGLFAIDIPLSDFSKLMSSFEENLTEIFEGVPGLLEMWDNALAESRGAHNINKSQLKQAVTERDRGKNVRDGLADEMKKTLARLTIAHNDVQGRNADIEQATVEARQEIKERNRREQQLADTKKGIAITVAVFSLNPANVTLAAGIGAGLSTAADLGLGSKNRDVGQAILNFDEYKKELQSLGESAGKLRARWQTFAAKTGSTSKSVRHFKESKKRYDGFAKAFS